MWKYERGQCIGSGRHGMVFAIKRRVSCLEGDTPLVAKVAGEGVLDHEIAIVNALQAKGIQGVHPIIEVHHSTNESCMVMPRAPTDLFELITRRDFAARNYHFTRRFLLSTTRTLHQCHEAGVYHLDIKPENILCTSTDLDTDFQIIDFGSSRMRTPFRATELACTLCYAPPEVTRDHTMRTDATCIDVYMLAATAYAIYFQLTPAHNRHRRESCTPLDTIFDSALAPESQRCDMEWMRKAVQALPV